MIERRKTPDVPDVLDAWERDAEQLLDLAAVRSGPMEGAQIHARRVRVLVDAIRHYRDAALETPRAYLLAEAIVIGGNE